MQVLHIEKALAASRKITMSRTGSDILSWTLQFSSSRSIESRAFTRLTKILDALRGNLTNKEAFDEQK